MTTPIDATQCQDDISDAFKTDCTRAMQLALAADDAPARCPSRNCRRAGYCHIVVKDDAPFCQGGIPGHVAVTAALILALFEPDEEEEPALPG